MSQFWLFGLLLVFLLHLVSTQEVRKGKCPNVRPQPNLQIERFFGLWYLFEQFFYDFDFTYKCAQFAAYPNPDGSGNVIEHLTAIDVNSGKWVSRLRNQIPIPNQIGRLALEALPGQTADVNTILDTDYTTYAVVYYCKQSGKYLAEGAFIFTRQPKPLPQAIKNRIYFNLAQSGIDPQKLVPQDQTNCPTKRVLPNFNITYNYGPSKRSGVQIFPSDGQNNQQLFPQYSLSGLPSTNRIVYAQPGQTVDLKHADAVVVQSPDNELSEPWKGFSNLV